MINDSSDSCKSLEKLGLLISEIKAKNDNVNIGICEFVPILSNVEMHDTIPEVNSKLSSWCETNEIPFINTKPYFTFGSGDIDSSCFVHVNEFPTAKLNRNGAVRLLEALRKYNISYLCKDWEKVKLKSNKIAHLRDAKSSTQDRAPYENRFSILANEDNDDNYMTYDRPQYSFHGKMNKSQINRVGYRSEATSNNRERQTHRGGRQPPPTRYLHPGDNYQAARKPPPPATRSSYTRQRMRDADLGVRGERRGCFQCGEYNHTASTCRFDHKLKCGNCSELGHKMKFCRYFSC